jgi:hypothetical protein
VKKFYAMHNNSGNKMDTTIGMGVFYAEDEAEAQEVVKKMFGPMAWAEEVEIDKKAC